MTRLRSLIALATLVAGASAIASLGGEAPRAYYPSRNPKSHDPEALAKANAKRERRAARNLANLKPK